MGPSQREQCGVGVCPDPITDAGSAEYGQARLAFGITNGRRSPPAGIAGAVREAAAILRASQSDVDVRRVVIAHELDVIAGRERRLLDALADGDMGAGVIRERLKAELSRRDTLTTELATLQAAEPMDDDALVRKVKARAAEASGPNENYP